MADKKTKTWTEKMQKPLSPHVKKLDFKFADLAENSMMLISSPQEIKEYIESIPKGETKTILEMRHELALKHKADGTCPVTTAIYLRMVCEVAIEEINQNKPIEAVTPFWRIVEPKSKIASKLPVGSDSFIAQMREKESSVD